MLLAFVFEEYSHQTKSTVCDDDILAVAQGRPDALHILYEKTAKSVYAYTLSLLKNTHDAEDVCQETYLSICANAGSYEPQGKPMAWIITIAKRHALTIQTIQNREYVVKGDKEGVERAYTVVSLSKGKIEEAEKTDPTAFSGVENTEQRLLLKATLDTLNNDERQIVMLKAVAGMKAREIGKVLEIPLNTVLSKYHRALKKMRLYIEKEDGR